MTSKVLLIMPAIERYKDYHHFPFGILSLGAILDNLGIPYDIFDERVEENPDKLLPTIRDYSIVGVSTFTGYQTSRAVHWLRYVRKHNPNAITIAGGPHVSALPDETASSPLVDFAVAGYAENSFGHLIESLFVSREPAYIQSLNIPGVHCKTGKSGGAFGQPTPRKYQDLKWGPLPYKKLNIDAYINPKTQLVMYVTQYGCPAPCTFCATPETRKWTAKPLEIVYKDFDTLDELTNFRQICFFDATLFTIRARTMELVEYLGNRFPGRQWLADARAAELIHYSEQDYLDIKKCKADLDSLVVGLESGSEYIAEKVIKKGRGHLSNFTEVAKRLSNAGIYLISGVIFGFPEDNVAHLKLTHDYVSSIRKIHPRFRISTTFFRPLPGTDLYDLVKDSGFIQAKSLEDWEKVGEGNHYKYNEWMDIPWIPASERGPYRKAYEEFIDAHGDIMV